MSSKIFREGWNLSSCIFCELVVCEFFLKSQPGVRIDYSREVMVRLNMLKTCVFFPANRNFIFKRDMFYNPFTFPNSS